MHTTHVMQQSKYTETRVKTSSYKVVKLVKVIWHDAASPPHTAYSVVFARLRQCAPPAPYETCSLGPPESIPQTESRSVQQFLHSSWQKVPILYNGPPLSPSKLPLRMVVSGPHLIHGFFGPPESKTQTASRSVQPYCRAHDRDRPTDRQTTLLGL